MAIPLTCTLCHATFTVKDALAGQAGKCPNCRALLQVPTAPVPAPPAATGRAARSARRAESATELMQRILGAFDGDFPRVRRTLRYRLAALFVTAAMLVLPALYVALIGLMVALLYWHAT